MPTMSFVLTCPHCGVREVADFAFGGILRSSYKTPEGARFYDASIKLYEGLSAELDFNLLFSQCGHLALEDRLVSELAAAVSD
jgi:glycine/D-amino acid oxidase-like deaminating enzyme